MSNRHWLVSLRLPIPLGWGVDRRRLDDSVEAKAQRTVAGHFALRLSGLAERNLENIGSTDASDRRSQMLDRMPFIRDNIAIRR